MAMTEKAAGAHLALTRNYLQDLYGVLRIRISRRAIAFSRFSELGC